MELGSSGQGAGVPGWLVEAVRAIARAQARRMAGYFRHFRDIDEDDQVQVGAMGVLAALGDYDARRGPIAGQGAQGGDRVSKPFSTFATIVVKRRLIDLHRGRARRAVQDAAIAVASDAVVDPDAGEPPELADADLAPWLRTVRVTAQRMLGDVGLHRSGRRGFSIAHECACAALMWRRGLSCRAAAAELADRPELRAAIGLPRVPSYRWLARVATKLVTRFPEKRPAANNGQKKAPTASVGELVTFSRRLAMHNLVQGEMRALPVLLTYAMLRDRAVPLSVSTIDKLVKAGEFPPPLRKVGRLKMWARADVEAWIRGAWAPAAKAKKRPAGANN